MDRRRTLTLAVIAAGIILVLVSVFAHSLGIGTNPGFGWKKLLGTLLGAALVVGGLVVLTGPGGSANRHDT